MPNCAPPDPHLLAASLAPLAVELVERIRSECPMVLWRELVAPLDGWDQAGLIMLLAAAVDPNLHPDIWWGWVRHRDAIEAAAPIVWDEDELPIEELDSATLSELVASMAKAGRPDAEIAEATGLSLNAAKKRRQRLGLYRDGRTAGVGVG